MTDTEKRIAIAWRLGLRWVRSPEEDASVLRILPDYLNDLNEIHKAWRRVIAPDSSLVDSFEKHLRAIVKRDSTAPDRDKFYALQTNATCPQRADAFLKAIGKL